MSVCGDRQDRAKQLVCQSLAERFSPGQWLVSGLPFDVVRYRDLILGWLDANPDELKSPSIVVTSKALAAAYPCKLR